MKRSQATRRWAVVTLLAVGGLLATLAGGCGDDAAQTQQAAEDANLVTVTDMAGREVAVAAPSEKVCAIGPGALRLVCYAEAADQVVGIEAFETQWKVGRPYILANPDLLSLPVIGQGGPDTSPDAEALIEVEPDVIFVAYLVDAATADELQDKTGIPVVVLSYGPLGTFDEEIMRSIEIVGQVTGNEQRAQELVDRLEGWLADLDERTADVPDDERPSVYAGAVGMKGTHGIESTQADYPPFTAINAANAVDDTGSSGSVMIDKEQLIEWDPDIIFIDELGYSMVVDDYGKNPGFYKSLTAVQSGKTYGYLPFNFYTTNVGTALADAYFMASVIYPDRFQDVDPVAKADEIYTFLLGKPMYQRMADDFGGFITLDPASAE